MSPSKTLSSSTDFLGAPVIRLPCSADFAAGRGGLLQLLSASLPSCCRFHPARVKPPLQSACDDPCCLRPTVAGSASGVTHFRGHFRVHFRYGPMAHCHPKDDLVDRLQRFSFLPPCYPSRVGGGALARWPPSAAQTARTVLPYAAFTKAHRWWDARKGINPTKLTSPYWLYSAVHGSCFQPRLRQRLHRCDQIRRAIQQSSRWKSFRT